MLGLMQERPLLVSSLIDYVADAHGDREMVTRLLDGSIHRYTWADCQLRSKQLANALLKLGVKYGDRVGTMAWNSFRHVEVWYATSGIGSVCHTVNPRLFEDQIIYILNHAEDRFLFLDVTFIPILESIADDLPKIEGYVIMTDHSNMPATSLKNAICFEDLVAAENADFTWPTFDENTACSLCYTSGTTGNPKGVLYSHRSNIIHTYAANSKDALSLGEADNVLPIVPMFHANAWGLPYCAAMVGAKLVLPGSQMDGPSVWELLDTEEITFSAAVPTVWLGLLQYLEDSGKKLEALERVVIGGSAVPRTMIDTFKRKYDVDVLQAWGMTETSPLGSLGKLKSKTLKLSEEEQLDVKVKQGRTLFGIEWTITDDDNKPLPQDGVAFGHLKVRGGWVVREYFKTEGGQILDEDGWFDTGDISTISPDGYMQITDRDKDVIKTGGEWISTIELENLAVGHPAVAEAAVIGVHHPKWDERPLLILIRADSEAGKNLKGEDVLEFMTGKVAKWWLPDDVVFVDEIPHTATGKIQKMTLRAQFKDYVLPTATAAE